MNKLLTLIFLLISLPFMVVAGDGVRGGEQVYKVGNYRNNGTKAPKYEYRAVWLTTIENLDWPHTQVRTAADVERQKTELVSILDSLQAMHINTVLLQTRVRGDCR